MINNVVTGTHKESVRSLMDRDWRLTQWHLYLTWTYNIYWYDNDNSNCKDNDGV